MTTQHKRKNGHIVKELIGRDATVDFWAMRKRLYKSVDRTRTDYEFYDTLRYGEALGYEFGGLFVKPLTELIASYVVGDRVLLRLSSDVEVPQTKREYTNKMLSGFMRRFHPQLSSLVASLYALGDQFMFAAMDGTISHPSPDLVKVETSPTDYRDVIAFTIETELDDVRITDSYSAQEREVKFDWMKVPEILEGQVQVGQPDIQTYPNLIGRIPAVHFAHDRANNEIFGRPIVHPLLPLLSRYDDLILKAADGAELMGNPIPVFTGLDETENVLTDYEAEDSPEDFTDIEGTTDYRDVMNWDSRAALLLGEGADFKFVFPGSGFTNDISAVLKLFFLLILDHTRAPEGIWGGALNYHSGMEEQMKPFYMFINWLRAKLEGLSAFDMRGQGAYGGLLELGEILLQIWALTDPQVAVAPVEAVWSPLDKVAGELHHKWVRFLNERGMMAREETVSQSGLVDDVEQTVADAQSEAEEERQRQQEEFDQQMNQALEFQRQNNNRPPNMPPRTRGNGPNRPQ